MKVLLVLAVLGLCAVALAKPARNDKFLDPLNEPDQSQDHGARLARATCDLLSISTPWGSVNHAACAAHCLTMNKGFRGGRCRDGVCHCRK